MFDLSAGTQGISSRLTKPWVQAWICLSINSFQIGNYGGVQNFGVRKINIIGDSPIFLSASASNNAFIIKVWPGRAIDVVARTFEIGFDQIIIFAKGGVS